MNSPAPVHLGLERIIRTAQWLARVGRGLRTAFAIEQKPARAREPLLVEVALRT